MLLVDEGVGCSAAASRRLTRRFTLVVFVARSCRRDTQRPRQRVGQRDAASLLDQLDHPMQPSLDKGLPMAQLLVSRRDALYHDVGWVCLEEIGRLEERRPPLIGLMELLALDFWRGAAALAMARARRLHSRRLRCGLLLLPLLLLGPLLVETVRADARPARPTVSALVASSSARRISALSTPSVLRVVLCVAQSRGRHGVITGMRYVSPLRHSERTADRCEGICSSTATVGAVPADVLAAGSADVAARGVAVVVGVDVVGAGVASAVECLSFAAEVGVGADVGAGGAADGGGSSNRTATPSGVPGVVSPKRQMFQVRKNLYRSVDGAAFGWS